VFTCAVSIRCVYYLTKCQCVNNSVQVAARSSFPGISVRQNPSRCCVSAFTNTTLHPTPIQPFRPTLPVSSYRIFSLNYTSHVIICETYLYAMYRSHKRAIASESNDPLGFTRVIFCTHNIAGVPVFEPPSPQSTRSRSGFLLVYSLFDSIHSILRIFFSIMVF
jgi:hypothetical protein